VIDGGRGLKAYDVQLLDDQRPAVSAPTAASGPAARHDSGPTPEQSRERAAADDELCEIFSEGEFVQRITEFLLESAPQLTGAQIVDLRGHLLQFARKNGWVD
jgi:hypothetical protein